MSSDEGSDIEMHSNLSNPLPKKIPKKQPKSPTSDLLKQDTKKVSTKEMIHSALVDLKSRKGTSLYAIKKYIEEKYSVDVEKINYLIKKYLKASVEMGTIVQTKGIGASGSFKLAAGKDKMEKKKKIKKKVEKLEAEKQEKEKSDKPKKPAKPKPAKEKKADGEKKTSGEKKEKKEKKPKKAETVKTGADEKVKKGDDKKEKTAKAKTTKMAKGMQTPAKKRAALMKRKSIGSIIKPPKMKPQAKA